jgi:hypothetical protein
MTKEERKQYNKEHYLKNRLKRLEQTKQWTKNNKDRVNKLSKIRYSNRSFDKKEKDKENNIIFRLKNPTYGKEWINNNLDSFKLLQKKSGAKRISLLTDCYIVNNLKLQGLSEEQIRENSEIIETNRLTILLKRELKKLKPTKN